MGIQMIGHLAGFLDVEIGKIFIEGYREHNLIYLSRDISLRMGYLC